MALELKQTIKLSQQLVMTPQLQQAIKLLQLNQLELLPHGLLELETGELKQLDRLLQLGSHHQLLAHLEGLSEL